MSDAIAEIEEFGKRWADAELRGDATALAPMATDDFILVGPVGFMLPKQQWLERYATGSLVNNVFTWTEVDVRTYGDAAIARGVQTQETTINGRPSNGQFRLTQVLVRRDGGWQLAGIHISPIGPWQPPAPPS